MSRVTTIELSPRWMLKTDHAHWSYGRPVLVNRSTGEAFEPDEMMRPYPNFGVTTAARGVARLAKTQDHSAEEWALIRRFVGFAA